MTTPFPVNIDIDAALPIGELRPIWRFFGYDEPNYTYMRDGRKLLTTLSSLSPHPVYLRTHNLLTSGDGTPALKWGSTGVYSEDPDGRPRYDWTILDRIFDAYHERGLRPLAQIGFMPEALSIRPAPYQHAWTPGGPHSISTGWAYPPRDYRRWGDLVHEWVLHCVRRYGVAAVERWYWEVWNEPNILYWRGTPQEYHALYDHAADAVKRALSTARVGGPHVAGTHTPEAMHFLRDFIDHCLRGTNHATGGTGSPLDFVAFHAKGEPQFVDGHVRTGIARQLQDIERGCEVVASYPELADTPIIIGESDPDGCAACPDTVYPQNGYRNGTQYASYTAAAFARTHDLASGHGVHLEGAVTWAFEFEDQPFFAGFRVLSTNGIALPVLNIFRMFGHMGDTRVAATSTNDPGLAAIVRDGVRGTPDVSALASRGGDRICALIWHYHDDDIPGADARVSLSVSGLADRPHRLTHYRIDRDHSNAFEVWKRIGSPQQPTPEQAATLERASHLGQLTSPEWVYPSRGRSGLDFSLPRSGVSLLVLE
jgi:xylan 1,4-beta-xylosidase